MRTTIACWCRCLPSPNILLQEKHFRTELPCTLVKKRCRFRLQHCVLNWFQQDVAARLLAAATWTFNHHIRLLAAAPAEMNNLRNGYADWTALSPNKVASSRAGRAAAAEHNCTCKREAHVWVLLAAHERAHAAPQLHIFTHESCVYP